MKKSLITLSLATSILLFSGCGDTKTPTITQMQSSQSIQQAHTTTIKPIVSKNMITTGDAVDFAVSDENILKSVVWKDENGKTLSTSTKFNRLFSTEGSYKIYLIATDMQDHTTTQNISIKVNRHTIPVETTPNTPPIAKAYAESLEIMDQESIHLMDDGSYDPDGSIVKYEWRDMDGILLSTTKRLDRVLHYDPRYDFNHDGTTRYVKTLIVTDNLGCTASKSFEIIVHKLPEINEAPIANAGIEQNVNTGDTVTLDGSGSSDPDGDPLTYIWSVVSQPTGSIVNISDNTIVNPTFSADKAGEYILQLVVNDTLVSSTPDRVKITQTPVDAFGTVGGTVTDAVNGNGIANLTLNIREGSDTHTGDVLRTINGDANGQYTIANLPEGIYTIEAIADNYITGYFTVESIANQINDNQNHALSPILQEGETRIVLTWSENPDDLDSHITGPDGTGGRFHVYYAHKLDGGAELDRDDITSYGPETITITQQHDGDYIYYVYDYSRGSLDELANSDAKVEIYRGSNLIATYNVPTGQGYYWTVFEMNGNQITTIDTIGDAPSP